MNVTISNSTQEVVGQLFLCGKTFSVCAYAIFLCYAIFDYQEEMPNEEKSPIDFLVKDLMHSEFWLLYYICLIVVTSLFIPPITSNFAYLIWHVYVFMLNFLQISLLILLYLQHLYVFHPDEFVNADFSIVRQKTTVWKLILTLFCLFLNYLVPGEVPMSFQVLAKGANYDR